MTFENFVNKAKQAFQGEKGKQFLNSTEDAVNKATGGKHDAKIQKARRTAERAIGRNDDEGPHSDQPRR